MKKNFFLFLASLVIPMCVEAQWNEIHDQSYVNVGAGVNTYATEDVATLQHIGYHFDAAYGIHLFQHVGMRFQMSLFNADNAVANNHFYLNGHFDVTYSISKRFNQEESPKTYGLSAFVGIGFIRRLENRYATVDNDFCIVPGLYYTVPLYNSTNLFAELKANIFPSKFDNNERASAMPSLSVGILHRLSSNPYRNGISSSSTRSGDDWFFGIGAGINSLSYNPAPSFDKRAKELGPAATLSIGKYFSPVTSLRLSFVGMQSSNYKETFTSLGLQGDVLLNINNMVYPKQNRKWNFCALAGGGLVNRYDYRITVADIRLGFHTRLWLSIKSDLYAEVTYTITPSKFAHLEHQRTFSAGYLNLGVGYCYNIGNGTRR